MDFLTVISILQKTCKRHGALVRSNADKRRKGLIVKHCTCKHCPGTGICDYFMDAPDRINIDTVTKKYYRFILNMIPVINKQINKQTKKLKKQTKTIQKTKNEQSKPVTILECQKHCENSFTCYGCRGLNTDLCYRDQNTANNKKRKNKLKQNKHKNKDKIKNIPNKKLTEYQCQEYLDKHRVCAGCSGHHNMACYNVGKTTEDCSAHLAKKHACEGCSGLLEPLTCPCPITRGVYLENKNKIK